MKRALLLLLSVVSTGLMAQEVSELATRSQALTFKGAGGAIAYRQFVLNGAKPGAGSLVVILHGRSGTGNDNLRQLNSPAVRALLAYAEQKKEKCLLLVPQCPEGRDWTRGSPAMIDLVRELVEHKRKAFDIPPERTLLTGISMGATACYALLSEPDHPFARALIVCGGGSPRMASRLTGNLRLVNGGADRVIPPERPLALANAVGEGTPNLSLSLTLLPGKDHVAAAEEAYDLAALTWLFTPPSAKPPAEPPSSQNKTTKRTTRAAGAVRVPFLCNLLGGRAYSQLMSASR